MEIIKKSIDKFKNTKDTEETISKLEKIADQKFSIIQHRKNKRG